jgi:hypothetical protein
LFACLDLKRSVSMLLDRSVTCFIEGGEDGTPVVRLFGVKTKCS